MGGGGPVLGFQALHVPVNGEPTIVDVDNLQTLQSLIGGYVEAIYGPGWVGYCNEHGKLDGLPVNPLANTLAGVLKWTARGKDTLVGDVVFCGPPDDEGCETDVPTSVLLAARMLLDAEH